MSDQKLKVLKREGRNPWYKSEDGRVVVRKYHGEFQLWDKGVEQEPPYDGPHSFSSIEEADARAERILAGDIDPTDEMSSDEQIPTSVEQDELNSLLNEEN